MNAEQMHKVSSKREPNRKSVNRPNARAARSTFLAIFAGLVLAACASAAQAQELRVKDAWANPPLVPQNNTAVYMTIENPSAAPQSIVAVTTKDAASAGIHQTQMEGKMMKMTPVAALVVPGMGSVELKRGGYHIMCTGVKTPLKPGDTLHLVLKLKNGKSIPVAVAIRAEDPASDGGHGMPMPMPGGHE